MEASELMWYGGCRRAETWREENSCSLLYNGRAGSAALNPVTTLKFSNETERGRYGVCQDVVGKESPQHR